MDKQEVLRGITFGARVAEEEGKDLSDYFVETDQWDKIFTGAVDIVYGPKGAGKSAIYSLLLLNRRDQLFDRGIMVIPAENPHGTTVFKDLATNPPADETEFRNLWKLTSSRLSPITSATMVFLLLLLGRLSTYLKSLSFFLRRITNLLCTSCSSSREVMFVV